MNEMNVGINIGTDNIEMDNIEMVYNMIAGDFDNTRYKAWPSIADFIDTFSLDHNNADIGCGNGKNMLYKKDLKFRGIDISDEFVKICKNKFLDVTKGNILSINFATEEFDNVICIAVIHHLEKQSDRIKAIQEIHRICKNGGNFMIYVWAFEQPLTQKRHFATQDELVPYKKINGDIFNRYYHLYVKNELENEITMSQIKFKEIFSGYERGNWYVKIKK